MTVIDLTDPAEMSKAIASGLVWSGPAGAQQKACELIASGAEPTPAYMPEWAKAQIAQMKGQATPVQPPMNMDGSGPA